MVDKNTVFYTKPLLNCGGKLLDLSTPRIMGILNITPDSFHAGSRAQTRDSWLFQAEKMLEEGADILDIGGMSTRPGAEIIDATEELKRVKPVVADLAQRFPEAIISIDTVWASVTEAAVEVGAHIINDISAGSLDADLFPTVARLNVPYILMHMQGTPRNMQTNPQYQNVTTEVMDFLLQKTATLRQLGVNDIIWDPGYGFGKTVAHNYTLLREMRTLQMAGLPLLAGISRKSMICKPLQVNPANALNGTTALHMLALQNGASILRVHDVKEARECVRLFAEYQGL